MILTRQTLKEIGSELSEQGLRAYPRIKRVYADKQKPPRVNTTPSDERSKSAAASYEKGCMLGDFLGKIAVDATMSSRVENAIPGVLLGHVEEDPQAQNRKRNSARVVGGTLGAAAGAVIPAALGAKKLNGRGMIDAYKAMGAWDRTASSGFVGAIGQRLGAAAYDLSE